MTIEEFIRIETASLTAFERHWHKVNQVNRYGELIDKTREQWLAQLDLYRAINEEYKQ